jgi:hypothetical protein
LALSGIFLPKSMAKKIFISYDYDHDKHYKNTLLMWDANDLFDFTFQDQSVDISVNSENANYIKSVIKAEIRAAPYFLCIIGKETYKSGWVKWEIDQALELKKKIIGVKIDNSYSAPSNIYGVGASWASSFTFDQIKAAIENN